MLARFLNRLMVAQDGWSRALGNGVQPWFNRFFQAIPLLRDFLTGRWLGHPIHAVLTDVPIGILLLVIVFDVLAFPDVAVITLGIGILTMVAAAVAGVADYADTDGLARTRATLHSTLMTTALVVYVVSFALRLGSGATASTAAVALSVIGFLVLSAGAYVGGDVVYVLGNMVSRHAFRAAAGGGTKWITMEPAELEPDGSIPENRPVKAKLGASTLVLVRQGEQILALHDICAHAGGSLSQGKLVDGQIECPLHFSRYRLAGGAVVRGPSVYDQPAYEVRSKDGGGWEARRTSAT
ncbi:MAG TPA: Rieske 2Fe-2S domain-containing protein [Candidatus Eisenbacteria bacterium]|nr:Rieske 2Fe-2S domain-containing protein [Candidatus Eisenbacteria bacterium]